MFLMNITKYTLLSREKNLLLQSLAHRRVSEVANHFGVMARWLERLLALRVLVPLPPGRFWSQLLYWGCGLGICRHHRHLLVLTGLLAGDGTPDQLHSLLCEARLGHLAKVEPQPQPENAVNANV